MFEGTSVSFDELLATAAEPAKEPEPAEEPVKIPDTVPVPDFIRTMNNIYRAMGSHVFLLHGNINDHPDNTGQPSNLQILLSTVYDTFWLVEKMGKDTPSSKVLRPDVTVFYTMNDGLEFAHRKGFLLWKDLMEKAYPEEAKDRVVWDNLINPGRDIANVLNTLNKWFAASRRIHQENLARIQEHGGEEKMKRDRKSHLLQQEMRLTVVLMNSEKLFPSGPVSQLHYLDRAPVAYIENWAKDLTIASRNRVILVTRHMDDIHETIRGGDSRVTTVRIRRPNLEDRLQWLKNFQTQIKSNPPKIGNRVVSSIDWAEGFGAREMAIQCAGVSRSMMETAIMDHWVRNDKLDIQTVLQFKRKAIESEYSGLVEFEEPTYGFSQVGTHENLKEYFRRKVIAPLREGSNRCSKGVLLVGPPGTGKTVLARALAYESKMNFMIGHLDRVFGGIVGETETNSRKLLEAIDSAAPLIVFFDEFESVLSSGRVSSGDGGTSARVFNSIMTWLSDESRRGKVVVVAASNRPDLLDAALTRPGRFDAILPCLPPAAKDIKGRLEILKALSEKTGAKFEKALQETIHNKETGLGKLLNDSAVWTGAEIELVLSEAADNASYANHKHITLEDWNEAMDSIVANTREVESMIDLALWFTNNLKYCPPQWREKARRKQDLNVPASVKNFSVPDYDRE